MFKLIFPNKNWPPEKMAARKITQKIMKIIAINPPMFQPLAGIYFKKRKSAVSFGNFYVQTKSHFLKRLKDYTYKVSLTLRLHLKYGLERDFE